MNLPEIYLIAIWAVISFFISKTTIPVLILLAKKKNLYDESDDFRKLHDGLIPTLGGVAIFSAFIISYSASSLAGQFQGFGYFIAASFILFAAGMKDDLITISPVKKLTAQILATALLVFGCDIQFTHMGGVFGIEAISPWVGIPLTFYTVIVVINAFNLIDGIDGLGGSVGVFVSLFFSYWFYQAGLYSLTAQALILAGSILGFLWYNRPPAKIFMGDTGSLMIGFFISVLAINFVEYSLVVPNLVFWQPAAPIIVAAVMAVPLYDTLRIFTLRALKGKSPFEADKDHIHHHLLEFGFSHGQIITILLGLNLLVLSIVIGASSFLSNTLLLALLLSLCVVLFPTNRYKRKLLQPFIPGGWIPEKEDGMNETKSKKTDKSDKKNLPTEIVGANAEKAESLEKV